MLNFDYWVASEGRKRLPDSGLRGGRTSAQPGGVVPSGTMHAVSAETDEVACGRPLSGLLSFSDFSWDAAGFGDRCQKCRAAIAARLSPSSRQVPA
jgi:hypothetical protein